MLARLLDRFRDFRNRKVSDPAFRRWAARFLLTRPVARRQTKALFDLTAGFVYSQILTACVRIDLFEMLAGAPLSVDAIAARSELPRAGAERLLKAAAALDLVEARSEDRYALGPLGAALVGNDGVKAMIAHHDILYGDLRDPIKLLTGHRDTELGAYWAYAGGAKRGPAPPPPRFADYTALMSASQAFLTGEVIDAWSFDKHRLLLDIGGGDGTFLIAVGKAAPKLSLALFDLPPVAAIAGSRLLAAGLAARAKVHAGSFFHDDLPKGADVITLNRVLHDHDDLAALAILKAARKAIAPDGTLLVVEPMAGTAGAKASGDAYFGFYLLAMGQGQPRTPRRIGELMAAAGFDRVRTAPTSTPLIVRIVSARPAGSTGEPA